MIPRHAEKNEERARRRRRVGAAKRGRKASRGEGRFVADIKLPGMLDIAFVRSPGAQGRIRSVVKPAGLEASVAADLYQGSMIGTDHRLMAEARMRARAVARNRAR